MLVGVYQSHPKFGEVEANVEQAVKDLSETDADLMVLPELFSTGYQFISRDEVASLSEEIPEGRTCRAMTNLARSKKMYLVFGIDERDGRHYYNSAAVVGPQGYVGTYRKVHLFSEEKEHFDPGDSGLQIFDIGPARIGVMICFDWLFPEAARILALQGADILCHPANLVLPHCQKAMVTRSLENGVFSATANRVGTEARGGKEPLVFTGASQILDHRGEVLSKLNAQETGVAVVEVDMKKARDKMITKQNDRLSDRRPELYGSLVKLK